MQDEEMKKEETEEVKNQEVPPQGEETGAEPEKTEAETAQSVIDGATPVPPEPTVEEKLKDAEDRLLRLHAEFDNYRKRTAREFADVRERAKIGVVNDFLPVYDFFQMAMAHAGQNPDFHVLKQGMDMILNEFTKAMDNLGLKAVPGVGEAFDPHIHEAVKSEPSETVPEGVILAQWKAGYKIGEQLVRPAMVVVSAGKPKEEKPAEEQKE